MIPNSRPKLSHQEALSKIAPFNISEPVKILGIRGYYKETMGNPVKNDRGIYDDAIFIITPDAFISYNANTDPSVYKKGIATLKAGQVYTYKVGLHGISRPSPYEALRQHGRVTVIRDGVGEVTDTAKAPFWINIHKGSRNSTSSEGCQTIFPTQYDSFMATVKDQLSRYKQAIVPYILIEA